MGANERESEPRKAAAGGDQPHEQHEPPAQTSVVKALAAEAVHPSGL